MRNQEIFKNVECRQMEKEINTWIFTIRSWGILPLDFTFGSSMYLAIWCIFLGQTNRSTPIGRYGLWFGAGVLRLSLESTQLDYYIYFHWNNTNSDI